MTPKEKANELLDSFFDAISPEEGDVFGWDKAAQCATITVNEVLAAIGDTSVKAKYYWLQVKDAIEKR